MQRVDLVIEQGTTWGIAFPLLDEADQPADLTGWSARAQVRTKVGDSTVLYEWSSDGGNIEVGNGRAILTVPPAVSSAWTWRKGVYDLELTSPSGDVIRPVGGGVRVDPEVTR